MRTPAYTLCYRSHMASKQRTVGVRELRGDLAGFVRRAQTGERITVSVSGEPVATLAPIQGAGREVTIHDLIAVGLVVAPRRRGAFRHRTPVAVWTGTRIERVVRTLRG